MKLSRGILKEGDAPLACNPDGDQGLDRVDRRIEIRLSGRHHPNHSAQDSGLGSQKAHLPDFCDVGGRLVIGKDLAQAGLDLNPAVELAPIEAHTAAVPGEQRGEFGGIAPVPALQQLPVQPPDLNFTSRRRILYLRCLWVHS
jgi:hypothetical protein